MIGEQASAPPAVDPRQRPFTPYGAGRRLFYSAHPEVLIDGPRGTGKTLSCLNKQLFLCYAWPGSQHLIVRKTMKSMRDTVLRTLEDDVIPAGHPALRVANRYSAEPRYPFGESSITAGGLNDPEKFRSGEYDTILIEEATQTKVEDLELLKGCMRHRAGPYHQIMLSTNPGPPRHWLIQRARDQGTAMVRVRSRHEDNPTLYDHERGDWTRWGREYIANLDELTGHRYWRLRMGEWRSAEGIAVPEWDENIHLIPRFKIPEDWTRLVVVDFGYTNPMCIQWWAIDEDRRAYRYREIYQTRRLVEDHARHARNLTEEAGETIDAIVADWDAEGRATFERYWAATIKADKDRQRGMEAVKARLRPAGDGKPRLFYLEDSLVDLDQELSAKAKPTCSEQEWDGLVWATTGAGDEKEDIEKKNDHGFDCARYLCLYLDAGEQDYTVRFV